MKIITILLAILVFLLIIILVVLSLHSMEKKFDIDCAKQNYQGIKSYFDLDINCSQIHNIKNITTVNDSIDLKGK